MSDVSHDLRRDSALLSAALKRVRRKRGVTTATVAAAMNMPKRTYERFEAGETRMNLDHINRFAAVTDSDPAGLIWAVITGSPELAARCADNKLATILTIAIRRLNDQLEDRLERVDPRVLIRAAMTFIDEVAGEDPAADEELDWLRTGLAELKAARPKPGR